MKNWIKLQLFYLGKSKKHQMFRARKWNRKLEIVFKKPIFNENYEQLGYIKDIFGPINNPFISVKTLPDQEEFTPTDDLYVKI